MKQENNNHAGIGFTGLLTIAFIVLKLLGKISWSWIWVLSPIWITALIVVAVIVVTIVFSTGYRRRQ